MTKLTLTEKAMTMDEKITYLENYTIITEYLNTDIGNDSHKDTEEQSQVVFKDTDILSEALDGVGWSLISGESYLELFSNDNENGDLAEMEPNDIYIIDDQDFTNTWFMGLDIKQVISNIVNSNVLDLDYTDSEEYEIVGMNGKEFEYDFISRQVDFEEFDNDFTPNKALL